MSEKNDAKGIKFEVEDRPEILDHMTRAEMVAELLSMLCEVKDEDLPVVCHLIQQVMKK